MSEASIIKLGGNIIDHPERLQAFLKDFASLKGPKILVHGGGKIATNIGERLGIVANYFDGRRITDAATLELVTMVYGGLVNKRIVANLQALDCNAIGLSGADGNCITAHRRPVQVVDYGFVGDIRSGGVNVSLLQSLMEGDATPVIAPLTHDGQGSLLNTNADTIAQELAKALSKAFDTQLIYCFEKAGVMRHAGDKASVIPFIDKTLFEQLQQQRIITDGMIPKLSNAFTAIDAGVKKVVIGRAEDLHQLIKGSGGTQIQ